MAEKNLTVPQVNNYELIIERATERAGGKPPRVVVVAPDHIDQFAALTRAVEANITAPILVGDKEVMRPLAEEAGCDLEQFRFVPADTHDGALDKSVQLVHRNEADIVLRGGMPVGDFVRGLLRQERRFVTRGKMMSHIAVIKPEKYPKLLLLSDSGVVVQPDLKQKIALAQNLIDFGHRLGIESPRVAVLAAVEVVYPQMSVTVDAAVLAKMNERRQIKGGFVDGPLSFDCAIDREAAESKGISHSEVAGQADAFLAPNIETAHGIYKAMALYGRAQLGGILFGGKVPVAIAATSDSADTIFHSIALAVLAA